MRYHTIPLHCIPVRYITLPDLTLQYLTLPCVTVTVLHIALPYLTWQYFTLCYTAIHSIPFYTYTSNWLIGCTFFNLHFRNIRPRRHGGPRGASQSLNQLRVAPPNKQLWHANSMTTADLRTNIFRPIRSDQRHLGDARCIRFKLVIHIRVRASRSKRRKTIHDHGNDS